jgi:Resolvase, N terminal domain
MRIGYARVSTRDQNLEMQLDALNKAGCQRIFTDKLSGAQLERPGLKEALSHLREADTLVVWKLDRLGRSVKGLVNLVNELETQKVHFQSITDGVDTKTPAGRFFFHVMASLAQMERELILERTRAPDWRPPGAQDASVVGGADDRQQGSGRKKAFGKRDGSTGGGAQLERVGPYVISMGAGLFTHVRARGGRWTRGNTSLN